MEIAVWRRRFVRWGAKLGRLTAPWRPRDASFSIPILCYHSWTINGPRYEGNDHIAMEHDLAELGRRGYAVIPLPVLVEVLRGERSARSIAGRKLVGLSCDDGRDFDFCDVEHVEAGMVSSFHAILERSQAVLPQLGEGPRAVSFVIASRDARAILDQSCGNGRDEWRDAWWAESAERGILGIANHGWDHVHETLPVVRQRENKKGSFFNIDSFEDAEAQIADAQREIDARTGGRSTPLFGYPYGHVSEYLRGEFFPLHAERLGIRGAFGTSGASVRPDTCIWDIPRFVCGWHWTTPEQFGALLDDVERGER